MTIVEIKQNKKNNSFDQGDLGLKKVRLKYDKTSPAIATYICPVCKTSKATDGNMYRDKTTMECENKKCRQELQIIFEGI
jgi:hypothetical protein